MDMNHRGIRRRTQNMTTFQKTTTSQKGQI